MKMKHLIYLITALFVITIGVSNTNFNFKSINTPTARTFGQEVDNFNGVAVYYNGTVGNVNGRNVAPDGYNLGLKYQCVEFVKRYYYEYFNHRMPNSYGNAKDFFNKSLADGSHNGARGLKQYTNSSSSKPKVNDLLIFDGTVYNKFGHVAIISKVSDTEIEIVQQNPGPLSSSRAKYDLDIVSGKYKIDGNNILGWLRKG